MLTIFRKSANANAFGQRQYWAADETHRRTLVVTATADMPIGRVLPHIADFGEYNVNNQGTTYTAHEWTVFMHEVVYKVTAPAEFAKWREAHPLKHKNNKQRMNPHRRALLEALRSHGGGYSSDYGRTSGALEYDVSVYSRKDFDDHASDIKKDYGADTTALLALHLPDDDAWWNDTRAEWEVDDHRWGSICESMAEMVELDLDYYSTHPVTGKKHDVEIAFAGRGGKHLLVTSFDNLPTPCDLAETLMDGDRTLKDSNGVPYVRNTWNAPSAYSNQWMQDFAQMVRYWDSLDVRKLVRGAYEYEENYRVEQLIDDELCARVAEAARLAATDQWFAVHPSMSQTNPPN